MIVATWPSEFHYSSPEKKKEKKKELPFDLAANFNASAPLKMGSTSFLVVGISFSI
jgi:hypothetical protein